MIAPSIAGRAQLIGPGACGEVPVRSKVRRSPCLVDPAAHPVDLVVGAVVVVVDLPEPAAVGDLAQARAHDPVDVLDDPLLRRQERVEAVLPDQLPDPLVGRAQRRDPRAHVERVVLRHAAVAQVGAQDVRRAARSRVTILTPGNSGASPKRSCGAADEAARDGAADVVVVHRDPRPGDQLPLPEDRHHEDPVVGVQRPPPRVVREEHVALADLLRRPLREDAPHELVDRRAVLEDVHPAVQAATVGGHERRVEVVALEHDERARQARRHPALVVVDRPQPVADHLEGDRVEARQGLLSGSASRPSRDLGAARAACPFGGRERGRAQPDRQQAVDLGAEAGRDDDAVAHPLDDRRPVDHVARRQRVAVVDAGRGEPGRLEVRRALALARAPTASGPALSCSGKATGSIGRVPTTRCSSTSLPPPSSSAPSP